MILGICTNMNARSINDVGLDQALYAKRIGLEYIELAAERIMRYDENRFESFKKEIAESPLPCLSCNSFIDPSVRLIGKEYNRQRVAHFRNSLRGGNPCESRLFPAYSDVIGDMQKMGFGAANVGVTGCGVCGKLRGAVNLELYGGRYKSACAPSKRR